MREKYESLALSQLKELAKVRGLKGTSTMKKAEVVEAMLAEDERLRKQAQENHTAEAAGEKENRTPVQAGEKESRTPGQAGEKESRTQVQAGEKENRTQVQAGEKESRTPVQTGTQGKRMPARPGRPAMNAERQSTAASRGQTRRTVYGARYQNDGQRMDGAQQIRQGVQQSQQGTQQPQQGVQQPQQGTQQPQQGTQQPQQGTQQPQQGTQQLQQGIQQSAQLPPEGMLLRQNRVNEVYDEKSYPKELDSGEVAGGILEVMPDGYGFIRCENYLPGEHDVYVAPSQIRRFGLKTGDILQGNKRVKTQQEKFSALLFIRSINGYSVEEACRRKAFEDMTPIFPNERIRMETPGSSVAMRVMDLVSPVGKGQRGMIVSPPKAGKTTLLKEVAKSILCTNPHMHMLILLIDERPEEVTDIKEAIVGDNVEVVYSTFDELPEHHKRVSEMAIERAKRLVEHKQDVVILLDSITRLARAYNLVVPPSGRTLSGGLDPAALHMPKRFFGAARNMREGGSLTILATALVDTGSKMDDVVYEEFKGTGNMEMILDRRLSEKRIFPAMDLAKSGTRREDLLLSPDELEAINIMRKALNGLKADEAADRILDLFARTRNNAEFVQVVKKNRYV